MSVGITVFVLVVALVIALLCRKSRQKSNKQIGANVPEASTLSQEPKKLSIRSVREIDDNSIVGPIRELPDSGKAELLDEQSPSGSGNEIPEISDTLPVVHELRTHRSSKEHFMLPGNRASMCRIFMSTKISRRSAFTVGPTDGAPYVETVISASAQQSMIRTSTATSNLKTEIYESYMRRPLDLDRPLPPTPISESPMVSPVTPTFQKTSSLRQRPKAIAPASRFS
ncbi:MAG: hypothetical protein Q9164_006303, partial [Protoblastenia rupestris]